MLSVEEKIHFLREVPSFKSLSAEQIETLAGFCKAITFEAGNTIFRQGELGDSLYIVVEGKVGIEREVKDESDTVSLTIIKSRQYLGFFSLFNQAPRSATATAMKKTVIMQIKQDAFATFTLQNPELLAEINQVLVQRLLEAYDTIAELTRSRKPRELRKLYEKLDF
jgi:CRP/FNR family transcriptional regulator